MSNVNVCKPYSSLVPKCDIQVLNGLPPKPNTKTKHWNQAMFELKKYGENIESMRDKLGPVKDKSLKMLMLKNKASGGRETPNTLPGQHAMLTQGAGQDGSSSSSSANHNPFLPPVVEVTPSDGGEGGGSYSDVDISSPGTPPSLQIDLRDSGRHSSGASLEKSPSKGRAMPSGGRGLIGAISRNSQVPGGPLDFNSSNGGARSVVVRSPSAGGSKMIKKRGLKAGAALSALVSTLAQRKRVAEQVGALTPVHQGAAIRARGVEGGLGVAGAGQEDADVGRAKIIEEPPVKNNSPFSSIYEHEKKTGIAYVDPNQKRTKRKTLKVAANEGPPLKKSRPNTGAESSSSASTATANGKPATDGDAMSIHSDPAAFVAKFQEYSNAAINALSTTTSITTSSSPSSSSSASASRPVASLKANNAASVRTSMSASPQSMLGSSSNNSGQGATPALLGLPRSRVTGGGGKKKATSKNNKNRGKSPNKAGAKTASASSTGTSGQQVPGMSSTLAALITAPPVSASAATSGSGGGGGGATSTATAGNTVSNSSSNSRASFMNQVTQGATSSRDTPSTSVAEVRGEVVAPRMASGEEMMSDFTEGTGLLADTIRTVNSSFLARLNQMMGSSDDMGYKYFVEKVSAVLNTVMIMCNVYG